MQDEPEHFGQNEANGGSCGASRQDEARDFGQNEAKSAGAIARSCA
jgi:hypothetical protein